MLSKLKSYWPSAWKEVLDRIKMKKYLHIMIFGQTSIIPQSDYNEINFSVRLNLSKPDLQQQTMN